MSDLADECARLIGVLREARGIAYKHVQDLSIGSNAWAELYLFLNAALDVGEDGRAEPLPGRALARNTDPSTSHLAAASFDDLADRHYAVYTALDYMGEATDEELASRFDVIRDRLNLPIGPQSEQSLRSRRSELTKAGHVVWAGRTRKTKSGRKARVWQVKDFTPF